MTESTQRTIYNLKLNDAMLANKHYNTLPNTTLNEKFNILTGAKIPKGKYPVMKYFVIGIGGEEIIQDLSGYKLSRHQCTDAALYKHIPFILRELDNDLQPFERVEYRLRNKVEINGKEYYAYWMKIADNIDYRPYIYKISLRNGVKTVSQLQTDTDKFLNPVPYKKPKTINDTTATDYALDKYTISFYLSPFDVIELKNVYEILGLKTDDKITELGLCHGYDIEIEGFLETIETQIDFHIDLNLDTMIEFNLKNSFKRDIVLGGSEPIFLGVE